MRRDISTQHCATWLICNFYFFIHKMETTQNAVCPSTITQLESAERSSMSRVTFERIYRSKGQLSLPRAQGRTLRLIIVVCGPESVLSDVLAIHTIEMIPKSMILTRIFIIYFNLTSLCTYQWWLATSNKHDLTMRIIIHSIQFSSVQLVSATTSLMLAKSAN